MELNTIVSEVQLSQQLFRSKVLSEWQTTPLPFPLLVRFV